MICIVSSLLAASLSLPPSQAEHDPFTLGSATRGPGLVPNPHSTPAAVVLSKQAGARTTQHSPSPLWSSFLPNPKGDSLPGLAQPRPMQKGCVPEQLQPAEH